MTFFLRRCATAIKGSVSTDPGKRPRKRSATFSMWWFYGAVLSMTPVASFLLQYGFSVQDGTVPQLFRHLTVSFVDWLFVPFNFLVVRTIDWRRGGVLFAIAAVSVVLNTTALAIWQSAGSDGGHMCTSGGIVLAAGWVHLIFGTLETTLLGAFVFARQPRGRYQQALTWLAVAYFVAAGASGVIMNNGFVFTDVVMVAGGFFFVVVYPRFTTDARPTEVGSETGTGRCKEPRHFE